MQQLLHQLNQPSDTITESDVKMFCKHSCSLHLLRGSCIADEYDPKTNNAPNIGKLIYIRAKTNRNRWDEGKGSKQLTIQSLLLQHSLQVNQ